MVAYRFVLTGFVAAASATALAADEDVFAVLLKRQEPGTPAYNCHDNCGTAITISKAGGDVCNDDIFLTDYKNCLQCAGPDNYDIWKYYGRTLSSVASGCGLETEPLSGKQEDVGPAQHPVGSGSSSSAAPQSSATAAPASDSPAPSSGAPAPTTGAPAPTSGSPAPTTVAPGETPASSAASGEPSSEATVAPITTLSSVSSGVPVPSSNGTATFTASSPPEQTTNAAAHLDFSAGMFGAVVMGMMYGLGN